ncbi:MAG: AAA family ATPase [Tabrizicola sp.]|nr:AAA family ATPase [Tabrizicola sp.]
MSEIGTAAETLYAEFFGLKERPFTLVPDPSFIYWSEQHKRASAVLEFGIASRAPITLITGEIGSGKTTLLQEMLSRMSETLTVGLVSNAQGGRGELLQWVLHSLWIPYEPGASYLQMFAKLEDFLIHEYAEGRRVILIFDEAQNLSTEGLEELRMLTNINANKDELIQLILVGQPELRDVVLRPNMRQLAQRVAASFHLPRMDVGSVGKYIEHRLKVAGGTGSEFAPEASVIIHKVTRGIPRLINQLCDFSMLYAWSVEERVVSLATVEKVLADGVFFGGRSVEEEMTP